MKTFNVFRLQVIPQSHLMSVKSESVHCAAELIIISGNGSQIVGYIGERELSENEFCIRRVQIEHNRLVSRLDAGLAWHTCVLLAVHSQLGCSTCALDLDLVPFVVVDGHVGGHDSRWLREIFACQSVLKVWAALLDVQRDVLVRVALVVDESDRCVWILKKLEIIIIKDF